MFITPPQPSIPGPRGQRITYDATPPSEAMAGDLYVDPDCNLWQMGSDWVNVGSVRGLPGSPGTNGTNGTQGIQGIQGIQGVPGTNARLIQDVSVTTNAAGSYTWTYPTAFAAPPIIAAAVQSATTDIFDVKVVSRTATQCVVQIGRTQAATVALLGLTILSVPASVGAQTVHIIAVAP